MKTLYGSIVSPYVRKVAIVLDIKNISFTHESVIPFLPEGKQKLLQMNPLGQMPVYQEEDFILSDSSVICAYLEKKYPDNSIYPNNPEEFAKCLWYEEYADTQLFPAILTVFFNTLLAVKFNREPDMHAVKIALEERLPKIFNYLDSEIGDKKYLAGNMLSLADISIAIPFLNFEFTEHKIDSNRWKNLSRYVDTIFKEKPIEKATLEAKQRFLIRG